MKSKLIWTIFFSLLTISRQIRLESVPMRKSTEIFPHTSVASPFRL